MTHRIDPAVESMQPPGPHSPTHAVLVDASLRELGRGHNSMLSLRDPRHQSIDRGA